VPGLGVICASLTCACAMLEVRAHAGIGREPKTHVAIKIVISGEVDVEVFPESGPCPTS